MRGRVNAIVALLAVGVGLAGCSAASGVNTEEVTSTTTMASGSPSITPSVALPPTSELRPSDGTSIAITSSEMVATTGLSAQEVADRAAIEVQWDAFWDVYLALPHTPDGDRQTMAAAVAVEPGLTNLLTDAKTVEEKGWDSYGQITHRISWPQPVDGKATAVIADCQDTSQAGSLEVSSGNKTTVGVARNPLQGTLVRADDGVWRVQQAFYLKDEPC